MKKHSAIQSVQAPVVDDVPLLEMPANPVEGQIYAANATLFNQTYLSQPLTAYAVGWRDNDQLVDLLNFIAPPVPTPRRFSFKKAVNAEAFLTESDDIRAINADFKR